MRRMIMISAVAFTLLCAVGVPVAQDGAPHDIHHGITPERRLARAIERAADVCFRCGDIAKEKGLYRHTRSFFNHALLYDPNHRQTRRAMGYRQRRGQWVLEEDLVPLSDNVVEARRPRLEQELFNETLPLRQSVADDLFEFVANERLDRTQRVLALYHALRICPEHARSQRVARAADAPVWYKHDLDSSAAAHRALWLQRADDGEAFQENTRYESRMGFQFSKRRTPWFIIHIDTTPERDEWAKELGQFAEASRSRALDLLGLPHGTSPSEDAQRLHYTVLTQRDTFRLFVERLSGIPDDSHRREVAETGYGTPVYSPYGSAWLFPGRRQDTGLKDQIAHDIASKEVFRYAGHEAYWLARGMGYVNSVQMNDTTVSVFYAIRSTAVIDSGGVEALPGLGPSPAGWRLRVALETAGDVALKPSDIAGLRIADYHQREMAYAFAFTDYLVREHQEGLREALRASLAARRESGETDSGPKVLERILEHIEMDEQKFMEEFTKWVQENYIRLPTAD
jgi:hypothetical protein